MNDAAQLPRLVVGPDPFDGWLVILPESSASAFLTAKEAEPTTWREYYEQEEPELIGEVEPEVLDTPYFDENGHLDARLWMVDDLDHALDEALDGLVALHDSMGGYPFVEVKNEDLAEIRARLTAAGYEIVGWDAVGMTDA